MKRYHFKRGVSEGDVQNLAIAILWAMANGAHLDFKAKDGSYSGTAFFNLKDDSATLTMKDGSVVKGLLIEEFKSGDGFEIKLSLGEKTYDIVIEEPVEEERDDHNEDYDGLWDRSTDEERLRALAFARMKVSYSFVNLSNDRPAFSADGRIGRPEVIVRDTRARMRDLLSPDFFGKLGRESLSALGFSIENTEKGTFAFMPMDILYLLPNSCEIWTPDGKSRLRASLLFNFYDFEILRIRSTAYGFFLKEK